MILQRTRPPLLETPFDVFDKGTLTPNDQFYVRWHWAVIPTSIEPEKFRLAVRGHINQPLTEKLVRGRPPRKRLSKQNRPSRKLPSSCPSRLLRR